MPDLRDCCPDRVYWCYIKPWQETLNVHPILVKFLVHGLKVAGFITDHHSIWRRHEIYRRYNIAYSTRSRQRQAAIPCVPFTVRLSDRFCPALINTGPSEFFSATKRMSVWNTNIVVFVRKRKCVCGMECLFWSRALKFSPCCPCAVASTCHRTSVQRSIIHLRTFKTFKIFI